MLQKKIENSKKLMRSGLLVVKSSGSERPKRKKRMPDVLKVFHDENNENYIKQGFIQGFVCWEGGL